VRKLILFMHMSLDGYIAAADGTSSLTAEAGANDSDTDESVFEVVAELTKDADTLLLGRVVANDLLGYWLTAEAKDPDLSRGARAYARWATGAHKAVLSNAEEQLPWENSELLLATTDADMERPSRRSSGGRAWTSWSMAVFGPPRRSRDSTSSMNFSSFCTRKPMVMASRSSRTCHATARCTSSKWPHSRPGPYSFATVAEIARIMRRRSQT